jgi:hypothetical protein
LPPPAFARTRPILSRQGLLPSISEVIPRRSVLSATRVTLRVSLRTRCIAHLPVASITIPFPLSLIYHHFLPVRFTCFNHFSFAPPVTVSPTLFLSPVRFPRSLSFPCQAATRYQFLRHTHSDEPPVSHPCTEPGTGYHRAHTLKRSLRDRQLAYTCHTPPPLLLRIATVQNQKSHIPPRRLPPTQRLTRPLGHLSKSHPLSAI